MSLRVDIQRRIMELLQGGTFHKITYDTAHLPIEDAEVLVPESVYANELSGGLSDSASTGATGFDMVLTNWRFEGVCEFTSEVDVSYFMLNELRKLNFNVDNLLVSIVPSGDFQVTHPPRNASHSGTKLTIGLTVNTRR
jgi:hypothetical protein